MANCRAAGGQYYLPVPAILPRGEHWGCGTVLVYQPAYLCT